MKQIFDEALENDKKYLDAAKRHVKLLDLFDGLQPDYHLHECAINELLMRPSC